MPDFQDAQGLRLAILPGAYAIFRLSLDAPLPACPKTARFWALTRADEELSLLCESAHGPDHALAREDDLLGFQVLGPLSFDAKGILASLSAPLARAGVWILAVSTFETDYLFVRRKDELAARLALRAAGFALSEPFAAT